MTKERRKTATTSKTPTTTKIPEDPYADTDHSKEEEDEDDDLDHLTLGEKKKKKNNNLWKPFEDLFHGGFCPAPFIIQQHPTSDPDDDDDDDNDSYAEISNREMDAEDSTWESKPNAYAATSTTSTTHEKDNEDDEDDDEEEEYEYERRHCLKMTWTIVLLLFLQCNICAHLGFSFNLTHNLIHFQKRIPFFVAIIIFILSIFIIRYFLQRPKKIDIDPNVIIHPSTNTISSKSSSSSRNLLSGRSISLLGQVEDETKHEQNVQRLRQKHEKHKQKHEKQQKKQQQKQQQKLKLKEKLKQQRQKEKLKQQNQNQNQNQNKKKQKILKRATSSITIQLQNHFNAFFDSIWLFGIVWILELIILYNEGFDWTWTIYHHPILMIIILSIVPWTCTMLLFRVILDDDDDDDDDDDSSLSSEEEEEDDDDMNGKRWNKHTSSFVQFLWILGLICLVLTCLLSTVGIFSIPTTINTNPSITDNNNIINTNNNSTNNNTIWIPLPSLTTNKHNNTLKEEEDDKEFTLVPEDDDDTKEKEQQQQQPNKKQQKQRFHRLKTVWKSIRSMPMISRLPC